MAEIFSGADDIAAQAFGHLPAVFLPAGPMTSGLPNDEKAKVRQQFAAREVGREPATPAEARQILGIAGQAEAGVGEEDSAVVQLVNKIILDAYNRNASDIHIEPYPGKQNTQVRIRVDGSCTVYQTIPFSYKNAVVSRIKIMSDLDIAERRLPQDGKIKFKKYGGKDIELRVATIPTQGGLEDVVMRILAAGEPIPLDKMGFSKQNHKNFISCVTKPYGLIFVCGPTGSGKTTTAGKLAVYLRKKGRKPYLVPVDIYRPAAIDQLPNTETAGGFAGQPTPLAEGLASLDPILAKLEGKTVVFIFTDGLLEAQGEDHQQQRLDQFQPRLHRAGRLADLLGELGQQGLERHRGHSLVAGQAG